MIEAAALLVVMGVSHAKPPTFTLHRFESTAMCEATARTLVDTAHLRSTTLYRGQVVAFCIPAEPRR